ncbi:MAG TPA: phosphoglycerate dehydrogenase [Vicinamibacterales bacterium]|jgi:D-3-phosphoglycerate dehydrogenase|nr:phosphoglycerate dehydrogenase [Vicinamibacterales bacterium]
MKIVVADDLPESALGILRAETGWVVDARRGRKGPDLEKDLADADALLVRSATKVTADLLKSAPKLRIIGRAGTGVDNIDVTAASGRGIVVVNAPGANSISVAEHACALMLGLARMVPAADQAMKGGRWEKKKFLGTEVRGKTLGILGLGRIGQEVAHRAKSFGMRIVAHDPFISKEIAESFGVELLSLDEVCEAADFLTLHLPATAETKHLFNDARFACVKPGLRIINTARGELIEEGALKRALEAGTVAAAALDVFENEPPVDWALAQLPQVVATPHIAASTEEAQELVGIDTATAVRDFLRDGVVRNAVNFPSIQPAEMQRLQPWLHLVDALAAIVTQMGPARIEAIGLRYYGALAESRATDVLGASAAAGVLRPILSGGVSIVNARAAARERGVEIIETRSTRARHYTSLVSLKLHTSEGERWVEGTVFEPNSPRLVSVGGVGVEAPLAGTMLIIRNDDQPGVIGEVGTILGRHKVNIANFALGRSDGGAIGVVNVDEVAGAASSLDQAIAELRKIPAVRDAWVVRLPSAAALPQH